MKHLLAITIASVALVSCDKGKSMITRTAEAQEKQALADAGIKVHYYPDGKIKAKIPTDENEKRHGVSTMYYADGTLKSEVTYNHGRRTLAKQYYKNGKLQMEFPYLNGMKEGLRKKYWDTGELQSELTYFRNESGTGLVEYNRKGKQITKYPKLQVRQINNLSSTGEYIVEVSFSEKPTRGTYYRGKLKNGRFKHAGLSEMEKTNGKARMVFRPQRGTTMDQTFDFVGSFKTFYGNPYIVAKSVRVSF